MPHAATTLVHHPISQHGHDGVTGLAFTGFVDGDDAVFPFLAALLARERDFALDGYAYIRPRAGAALTALNLVTRDLAGVKRLFPVDEVREGILAPAKSRKT